MRWTEFAVKEARHTLREWESRVGVLRPPIAVEDLADLLYLLAIDITLDLPRSLAGRLYAEQQIIEVRQDDPHYRQRFTIAHEVGHYRLHVIAENALKSYACLVDSVTEHDTANDESLVLREDTLPGFSIVPRQQTGTTPNARDIKRREIEANAFAAELLMPAHLVEDAVTRYGKDVIHLAELFDVSRQAMQIRLEKLLILPPPGPQQSFLTDM